LLGGCTVSEEAHSARLDRVEADVSTIRTEIGGIKENVSRVTSDVRGLGNILSRIEQGVENAQKRFDDDRQASRLNPVAMGSVLLTIISILVGGAWLIAGGLATTHTRLDGQERFIAQMTTMRDRELDVIQRRIDRLEARGVRSIEAHP
jgi:hypothetical protein